MTGDALHRAILADPGDDTPRLVYADWLEENDRACEAEFLRVDCRLETTTPEDPDYTDLLDRREELRLWLTTHAPGPTLRFPAGLMVDGGANWWRHTLRGFPRFLEFEGYGRSGARRMRELGKALEQAFAKLPTRWLVVRQVTVEQLAELLRQPVLASIDRLTIQLNPVADVQDELCEWLARCPYLRNLRELSLVFPFADAGAAALARSDNFGQLKRLWLDPTYWWTPAAIRALGAADWFRNLHWLHLDELTEATFEELCRLDPFPNLHTLELNGPSFPTLSWQVFARSNAYPRLARLANGTEMTQGQVEALAGAALRLADLELDGCGIFNDGARMLARSPWFGSLRRLSLRFNHLGPAGVAAVARARALTHLRYLDLRGNTIGGMGLRAIAANRALRKLTTLLLGSSSRPSQTNDLLTTDDFPPFLTNLDMPNLRHLDLSGRPLGPKAARLLTGEKFRTLTRLNLSDCKLTDACVRALLNAPALQNLMELDVSENKLRTGVVPLTDRHILPHLGRASLHGNRFSQNLARTLQRRPGVFA